MEVLKEVIKKENIETDLPQMWWMLDEEVHTALFETYNRLSQRQSFKDQMYEKFAKLYSPLDNYGLDILNHPDTISILQDDSLSYNIVKSCIDTAASKIAKNRPKAQILTSGGDLSLQDKAKKLTKYVEGRFYANNAYELGAKIFVDACVFGTGCVKVFEESGDVMFDRVIIPELRIDEMEGLYGKPKTLYHSRLVSKYLLMSEYPELQEEINKANYQTNTTDLIRVVEAWRLTTDKTTGRHIIAVDSCTILDEPYDATYFPFVFIRWNNRLTGFEGQGLAEELVNIQTECDRTLNTIRESLEIIAVPRIFAEEGSLSFISNEIGNVIEYKMGKPRPEFYTAQALTAEVYNHLYWLIKSGYEVTGVSQMSATSSKPTGLNSGKALREYSDIETERFMLMGRRYENFYIELALLTIKIAKQIYKTNKKMRVTAVGTSFIESITWADVDMEEDLYFAQTYPTALLPTTPAGRIAKIEEMVNAGWIDKDDARSLFDFPDVEAFKTIRSESDKLVKTSLEKMMSKGEYTAPDSSIDVISALNLATIYYINALESNMPDDTLYLLQMYKDDLSRLVSAQQPIMQEGVI